MRNKEGSLLIAVGLLLMAAALCLGFYNLLEGNDARQASLEVVEELLEVLPTEPAQPAGNATQSDIPGEREIPDHVLDPGRGMPTQEIQGYRYVGMLEIPALGLLLPVMEQWDYTRLQIAPCRYSGTPYQGNFVIAAHNYPAHFGNLKELRDGEEITFTDMERNVFTYQVVALESLQPTDVEYMTAGEYDLSLFTCTVGGSTRVTVRCDLLEE